MITIYTKPNCPQCDQTKRVMDMRGIEYTARDVATDEQARAEAEALAVHLGRQMPIVVADGDQWSGFRPDRIAELGGQ